MQFQDRPRMLPNINMPSFRPIVPFNWKVKEAKRKLKIKSMTVDSMLMKRKDAIKHKAIASRDSTETRRLPSFTRLLSSLLHGADPKGILKSLYILRFAQSIGSLEKKGLSKTLEVFAVENHVVNYHAENLENLFRV